MWCGVQGLRRALEERNRVLVDNIQAFLHDDRKFDQFRKLSASYRKSTISAEESVRRRRRRRLLRSWRAGTDGCAVAQLLEWVFADVWREEVRRVLSGAGGTAARRGQACGTAARVP